ncbi:TPA: helix-turn-helix domain-containing protein [Salmonella enterica]|nr:helix-turn-helix domain-containing protein [Salmonella enterica]
MLVTMSDKELSRINIIQSVIEKRMRRRDAAHQLALTERQTQRLMNRFRESGAAGLANLRRGLPGNHSVDNKRLGAVLKLAQSKMDELERDGKRDRSKKMPKRRAQARVQEQLRAINPVLASPEEFRASLKR